MILSIFMLIRSLIRLRLCPLLFSICVPHSVSSTIPSSLSIVNHSVCVSVCECEREACNY